MKTTVSKELVQICRFSQREILFSKKFKKILNKWIFLLTSFAKLDTIKSNMSAKIRNGTNRTEIGTASVLKMYKGPERIDDI